MKTALVIVILCAAFDLAAGLVLLGVVWLEHRRVRRESEANGEPAPSAARQLGCLAALATLGLIALYGTAWLLLD
jgi:hypothetical protein